LTYCKQQCTYLLTYLASTSASCNGMDMVQLVVCFRDGATRSGLLCTLSYVLERLKVEQDVDVFQSVRHARISRPQIVPVFVSLLLKLLLFHIVMLSLSWLSLSFC